MTRILPLFVSLALLLALLENGSQHIGAYDSSISIIPAEATQTQEEEAEGETEDLPWVPIVIIAFAIPLAVLLIPSFFGKGGSGGH